MSLMDKSVLGALGPYTSIPWCSFVLTGTLNVFLGPEHTYYRVTMGVENYL